MAIQMVRREIQEYADVGAKSLDELELKTAQLDHRDRFIAGLLDLRNQRRADIPSENRRNSHTLQDVNDQRSCRRLAIRTRDANHAPFQKSIRQFDLAPNCDALRAGGLQQRRVSRHSWTWNNQILLQNCLLFVAAEFQVGSGSAQRPNRFADFTFWSSIRRRRPGTARHAKLHRCHTRSGQSHNQHALASQFEGICHLYRKILCKECLITSTSTSSTQTTRIPTPRSRSAQSLWTRSSPSIRNGDESAPF